MAITGNREQIRAKVRRITGRLTQQQMSDDEINDYIEDFYVYDLPAILSLWNLHTSQSPIISIVPGGERILVRGQMTYEVDLNKFGSIGPPFYIAGTEIRYMQDVRTFMDYFPSWKGMQTLTTGTGIAGPYGGVITNTPILDSSVFISAVDVVGNTLAAYSNAAGVITGDVLAGGAIDYTTGAVVGLTWTAAIGVGEDINVQSLTYAEGKPSAVLFNGKSLLFYPVPDTAYEPRCSVYYNPEALTAGSEPEIRQWWKFIALGVSKEIFIDSLDVENLGKIQPIFKEQEALVGRQTLKQLSNQRVATIYMEDTNPYGFYG